MLEVDDFQVLDIAHQVEDAVGRGFAGVTQRPSVDAAVNCRTNQPDTAAVQQRAGLLAEVFAAKKDFVDGAIASQCLLFVQKQAVQGAGHTDQHGDLLVDDQLRDFAVIVVSRSAHRPVPGFEVFQHLGEAGESAVQPAAEEQVHDPIARRIEPGRTQTIGSGPHLALEIAVTECGKRGCATAAPRAKIQLCVWGGWLPGKGFFVHDRHPDQQRRRGLRIKRGVARQRGRRQADRHPSAQALQGVDPVMRFAVVAIVNGFDRRNARDPGGDQRLRQFTGLCLGTQQGAALQHVAPRQQRRCEHVAGHRFEQQAAKQRRRFELAVMAPDHAPAGCIPDLPGLPDEALSQLRHCRAGGDLRGLFKGRREGRPVTGTAFERLRHLRADVAHDGLVFTVHQQPLRAGTGLLIEAADLIDDGIEHRWRHGVRAQVNQTDAVPPVDPATAWRELLADGVQRVFATPGCDAVGVLAQLADLRGGRRQHRNVTAQLPSRITFEQRLEQLRGETAVAAARTQPVDVTAQQAFEHCAERQQRSIGRGDVHHQAQRAPAFEARQSIVDAAQ